MQINEQAQDLTRQMNEIYDADRDYEICLADLSSEDQEKYNDLKQQRNALLK